MHAFESGDSLEKGLLGRAGRWSRSSSNLFVCLCARFLTVKSLMLLLGRFPYSSASLGVKGS